MNVTTTINRLIPCSSSGYGVKITFTYTSFDEKEIDFVEEHFNNIINTVVEVNANE